MRWGWTVGIAAMLGTISAPLSSVPRPGVEALSPEGTVERIEQVKVRFATSMVSFGDPRAASPLVVGCGRGQGRWVDARTFVWDFAGPLAGGLRCEVALRPGLRDNNGAVLPPRRYGFDTGGPTVRGLVPSGGSQQIDEGQVFLLALNAPAVSIAGRASCAIEGIGEVVPLDPLPAKARDAILRGAGNDWSVRALLVEAGWRADPYDSEAATKPRGHILAVKCRRALPPGSKVSLLWGGGIRTADGLAAGVDRRFDFRVRPAFAARFSCERVNPRAGCLALSPLELSFAGEVPIAKARQIRLVDAKGVARAPDVDPKARSVSSVSFAAPLAERMRYRIELPPGLRDDAGRPLVNAGRFPLDVATDENPPIVKFAGTFGILESREGGVLPVTVRGVEARIGGKIDRPPVAGQTLRVAASDATVAAWLRRLDKAEERTWKRLAPLPGSDEEWSVETTRSTPLIAAASAGAKSITVPRAHGTTRFEVIGIPLGKPGFHVVELASPRLGSALLGPGKTRYVATGALVTDLSVHFQWGRGRSLVWVTRLGDAAPVAGAAVAISNSCTGARFWSGSTDAAGRAYVADGLPEPDTYGSCDYGAAPLMVSARKGGDFSFTLTKWSEGIQPGDFNLPTGWGAEAEQWATVFDRTLLRAGDTVSMKHVLRTRSDRGFAYPRLPAQMQVVIRYDATDQAYTLPLAVDRTGIGETRWAIPKAAALGDYSVELRSADGKIAHRTGEFTVDEFRLPTMKAVVSGPKAALVRPKAVPVDLFLGYTAGGGVSGADVKLRTLVRPRGFESRDYPDFAFGGEAVAPGAEALDEYQEPAALTPIRPRETPLRLGRTGAARSIVDGIGAVVQPSELVAEMDYADANGEVRTASARLPLEPAAVRVGVATDGWLAKADDLRLKFIVLDLDGRPVRGQRVEATPMSREINSYRKRLIGGFYAYDNSRVTRALPARCSATTDARGLAECRIDVGVSGEVIARASVRDARGFESFATRSVWLAGDDDWWFGGDNGDRMDVVAEQPEVPAGGIARFQVRMPFREATALVTVLRDGVIDSFVTKLSGREPVVSVRMTRGTAPNVYVSVLAVRGRVAGWRLWLADLARRWHVPWVSRDAAYPTALVDLAKPSYRFGIARVRVGWDDHRLDVKVRADRASYAVGQRAQAVVSVAAARGGPLPAGAEVSIAAVNEALLSLKDNESWKLLDAMMTERGLFVFTSTAQTQVVGKRHYGLKAVPAGGGGGDMSAASRRDFNPLLLWKGRVRLDRQGRATVSIPLNDSLSAFRIVAVATAGPGRFGTGSTVIRTRQDLMLLPGIPPVARTGDRYVAGATVRNTTKRALTVRIGGYIGSGSLPAQSVTVPAGDARLVRWTVTAPSQPGAVEWRLSARAGAISDAVTVPQRIEPLVPVAVWQSTLLRIDRPLAFDIAAPTGALPGRGGIDIALSAKLTGSLASVRAWMAAYPYDCAEQQLSRAVATGDRPAFDRLMEVLPRYLDGNGLVRFFPADWMAGDESLTAYMLALSHDAGWAIPDETRGRMVAGLQGFVRGQIGRADGFAPDDLPVRKLAAIAALAREGKADAAMLDTIEIAPDAWPTTAVLDWLTILQRLPEVPTAKARRVTAEQVVRARLDLQGTAMSVARSDGLWWLLNSGDATAAKLLLVTSDLPGWKDDVGRLARGLILRQRRGAWDTTVANAWATVALGRFSRMYESAAVTGSTLVDLGRVSRRAAWTSTGTPGNIQLPWPPGRSRIALSHSGTGAPWAMVTARAAVPLQREFGAGFALRRMVTPVAQAVRGRWSAGDVMRVRLEFDSKAEMTWVALADPIPAGAVVLGGALGGRSQLLDGDRQTAGSFPTYVERRQEAVHVFWNWIPKGRTIYEYTVRLNTPGTFGLPPSRVEAMYLPEMFGVLPNPAVTVAASR